MNIFRLVLSFLLTICLLFALNTRIADKPAFGKLLNPFTGFYHLGENPDKLHLSDEIIIEDLDQGASVFFDERRIPHIIASNEHDLYFLQGYTVASLRLWQMEFQVLAAEGRISEILGNDEKYINFDKNQRRLGLPLGAKNKLEVINNDPFSKELIDNYTAGVNAYIHSLKEKDYPLEYQLIGYKPEDWSPYKTALLLMNMSNVLTSTEYDIENSNFLSTYGQALFDSLYRDDMSLIEPVIETPTGGWLKSFERDSLEIIQLPVSNPNLNPLSSLIEKTDVQVGSNNWALSGDKTASGFPLLANDPHLKLSFPSVWIEMHLVCPDLNTYGVVFPGAPGIIIGFNDYIGWGVTNASRDVKDWYEIEFKDDLKDFYRWENGWRATTKEITEIKIKGAPSIFDTIIYTHLGPVTLENFETQAGKKNFALQWMAHLGSQEYMTFYKLNRSKNYEDYLEALRYYQCPAQNFVFACVDGDIALRQQGLFPVLSQDEGMFYQDGSKHEAWSEFIPFEENPMMHNPERNFVSSANQHAVDGGYPYFTNGVYEYFRNRVINDELRKMNQATVQDFIDLQFNNYNLMAAENLSLMLQYIDKSKLSKEALAIYDSLNIWDHYNMANSNSATYFQIFSENYYTLLWDEFVNREVPGGWDPYQWKDGWKAPNDYQTFRLLQDSVQHSFIDNQSTTKVESTNDLMNKAFVEMISTLNQLATSDWGKYKNTYIEHLAMIPAFSTNLDIGGNYKIVNASGKYHGPSWRMILDFDGGKIKGYGVYPGGQSGNPGSKYYDNMVNEWANANYHDLMYSADREDYRNDQYFEVKFKKH